MTDRAIMGPDEDCPECGVYRVRHGAALCGVCETASRYEVKIEAMHKALRNVQGLAKQIRRRGNRYTPESIAAHLLRFCEQGGVVESAADVLRAQVKP